MLRTESWLGRRVCKATPFSPWEGPSAEAPKEDHCSWLHRERLRVEDAWARNATMQICKEQEGLEATPDTTGIGCSPGLGGEARLPPGGLSAKAFLVACCQASERMCKVWVQMPDFG